MQHESASRKGGPTAMPEAELVAFLAAGPTGALCVETADGRLQVVPAQVIATRGRTIEARIEGPLTLSSGQACIVADRYASYEEIRGVISRGNVRIGEGGASLVSEKLSSFSFAGTLNGPPRAPGSLAAKP